MVIGHLVAQWYPFPSFCFKVPGFPYFREPYIVTSPKNGTLILVWLLGCQGQNLQEEALRKRLERALLTEEEFDLGPEVGGFMRIGDPE